MGIQSSIQSIGENRALVIEPQQLTVWLELRLLSPVKHDDPGFQDGSNARLFRRQLQRVERRSVGRLPTQEEVDALCRFFPVPADIELFFESVSLPQYIASIIVRSFAALYSGGDGAGLMEGMRRWTRLEDRCRQAAVRSDNLLGFWSRVCEDMRVPVGSGKNDRHLLTALTIPPALGGMVLNEFVTNVRLVVMLGREWNQTDKLKDAEYARKAGVSPATGEDKVLHFEAPTETAATEMSIRVPEFSGNSFRHEGVREPGMWHLLNRLEVPFESVLGGVAALLENGGNIAGGTSAPTNAFGLMQIIRRNYPLFGLMGGAVDSFILGQSNLASVNAWIVCQENNEALALTGVQSSDSIFGMLDNWTLTTHANRSDQSPMPFSFETLQKGVTVMVRLGLSPYIRPLEIGCLAAALETYRAADATIGGGGARGFGRVAVAYHQVPESFSGCHSSYEAYLEENREFLREGLMEGTLGTGKVLCK